MNNFEEYLEDIEVGDFLEFVCIVGSRQQSQERARDYKIYTERVTDKGEDDKGNYLLCKGDTLKLRADNCYILEIFELDGLDEWLSSER